MRLLCSTGAFSRFPDLTDHRRVLEFAPRLPVDALELLVFPTWDLDAVAAELASSAVDLPVVHADKTVGAALGAATLEERAAAAARLEDNVRFAARVGAGVVVLHLWDLPESDADLSRNIEAVERCHDAAAAEGVVLAIETTPCDHATPLANVAAVLAAESRAAVALDTEFLALHEELDAALAADWLWHRPVVRHVHVKDYGGSLRGTDGLRRYLQPGEGELDFPAVIESLRERGFTGTLSLESSAVGPDGEVDVGRIERSLDYLADLVA